MPASSTTSRPTIVVVSTVLFSSALRTRCRSRRRSTFWGPSSLLSPRGIMKSSQRRLPTASYTARSGRHNKLRQLKTSRRTTWWTTRSSRIYSHKSSASATGTQWTSRTCSTTRRSRSRHTRQILIASLRTTLKKPDLLQCCMRKRTTTKKCLP